MSFTNGEVTVNKEQLKSPSGDNRIDLETDFVYNVRKTSGKERFLGKLGTKEPNITCSVDDPRYALCGIVLPDVKSPWLDPAGLVVLVQGFYQDAITPLHVACLNAGMPSDKAQPLVPFLCFKEHYRYALDIPEKGSVWVHKQAKDYFEIVEVYTSKATPQVNLMNIVTSKRHKKFVHDLYFEYRQPDTTVTCKVGEEWLVRPDMLVRIDKICSPHLVVDSCNRRWTPYDLLRKIDRPNLFDRLDQFEV